MLVSIYKVLLHTILSDTHNKRLKYVVVSPALQMKKVPESPLNDRGSPQTLRPINVLFVVSQS